MISHRNNHLKAFFSYQGRIARKKYFLTDLIIVIPVFLLVFLIILVGMIFKVPMPHEMLFALPGVLLLCTMLSFPTVKRFHDIGLPGWLYVFLLFSPIYEFVSEFSGENAGIEGILASMNLVIFVLLLFKKGTVGPNKYGSDPLEPENLSKKT